jgi:hypothetical protein
MKYNYQVTKQFMKKLLYTFALVQGIAFSICFGMWALQDYKELQYAVATRAQHAEMRHRISVGFDGVWYLLSNIIILSSIKGLSNSKKEQV